MVIDKPVKNVYCIDKEDLVVRVKCGVCKQCWMFVQSYKNSKNGGCVYGGPFKGYDRKDVEKREA